MFNPTTGLRAWWARRVAISRLHRLDDHLLADLGVERENIVDFVGRQPEKP